MELALEKIVYTKPSITELEIQYVNDAVREEWGEHCYNSIVCLEQEFAEYLGVSRAITTSSCTGALTLGLAALGIGHGDEVIIADTNWIASVAPVVHLGATPVFVDIDPKTWCIDPNQVRQAITQKTKAIIAVHLYGNLCDMTSLTAIAQDHNLALIEDAAEALGSRWEGALAGSIGRFATFSFHGTKTMTTGEGGMFVTNDEDLYQRVLCLSNHGRKAGQSKQFWPDELGYKFKMSNIQAALGRAQLARVEELVGRKREILHVYKELFSRFDQISLNPEPANVLNCAWMPTAVFSPDSGITREVLLAAFKAAQIDARVFFYPLSSLDMFGAREACFYAGSIAARAINLPSFHDITREQQTRVAEVVYKLMENN
jgi:perosamine synthetase